LPRIERFVKQYDIKVAFHNHGPEDKNFPSPYDALKHVRSMDRRMGLCIDIGHTVRTGPDVVRAIADAGPRILDMHANALRVLTAARYAKILGANDGVRVGVVGFSDRFRQALLAAFGKVGKELNFEIVAVSDIWNRRRDEGVAGIEKVMGAKPRPFRNNEEMYDAKLTDAVMISTPDFLHAHHGVDAIRAGQDAYIEKPLAHTMEKAVAIRDAVKNSNRV